MNETEKEVTLGSLFDGAGGFPYAGSFSGIRTVWSSEIEPFPIRVTTKRMPQVKHYGDVSALDGAKLKPVDIITFGSPCQDLSISGKRAGLSGSRSSLFFEAVRIVKEMREATNGEYPKYIVWENVPGAFSSNHGEDFRCVLENICRIKEEDVSIPKPEKWNHAGLVVGDGYSVAWRVLDAQYWGVPQRRKRIYLVGDLDGGSAGKILFESEGMSGYTPQGFCSWQGTAGSPSEGSGAAGAICLNDQGGDRMDVSEDVTGTLRAQDHGHPPVVMGAAGFCTEHSAKSRSIGYYTGPVEVAPTSRTLDTSGGNPACNQGGIAVVSVQGSMIGRADKNGPQGSGINEDVSFTLNTIDRHAVAFSQDAYDKYTKNSVSSSLRARGGIYGGGSETLVYSTSKSKRHTTVGENIANTLVSTDYKDPPTVAGEKESKYIVRRLTPTECARLQGFPDDWCDNLGTDEPTDEEMAFWRDVFETHRRLVSNGTVLKEPFLGKDRKSFPLHATKPKTDNQIKKWLKSPHSDSAEYKMWGNSIAIPCALYVLSGIKETFSHD